MRRTLLLVPLLLLTGCPPGLRGRPDRPVDVRVSTDGGYCERFAARTAQGWRILAETEGPYRVQCLTPEGILEEVPRLLDCRQGPGGWQAEFTLSFGRLFREVRFLPEYPWLRAETRLEVERPVRLSRLLETLCFLPKDPEFAWSQNLKWEDDDALPHWTFKFPALLVQKGPDALSLFADPDTLTPDLLQRAPMGFDFQVGLDGRYRCAYGIQAFEKGEKHHVHYRQAPEKAREIRPGTLTWASFPVLDGQAEPRGAFRKLLRWTWAKWGSPNLLAGAACQRGTGEQAGCRWFDDWRHEAWEVFGPKVWNGRGYSTFWIEDPNVWFDSWFNSTRTACGDPDPVRRRAVLDLILGAPRKGGAFASVCVNRNGRDSWESGARKGGHAYHPFDMTWTATWLLRFPSEDPRILPFCEDLAGFLLKHQLPSGCVPAWFDYDLHPEEDLKTLNAETSGTALFLAELYRTTKKPEHLGGALQAADFIWREVVPTRKWFDFEAFVSCSRKPFDFYDPRTRQHPANTLSMIRAAQAEVALFEVTGKKAHLDRALVITDFLLLHQQPWSHPLMAENLFGGLCVQNTDMEWSDTRAAYGAELLFSLYGHTGELEHLERAVAVLRANFKVSPRENWGHQGDAEGPTGKPKFHWGTGSGAATVEMFRERFGSAYIHAGRKHGVGIDGCTIRQLAFGEGTLKVRIDSPFDTPPRLALVLDGLDPGASLRVDLNGEITDVQANARIFFTPLQEGETR